MQWSCSKIVKRGEWEGGKGKEGTGEGKKVHESCFLISDELNKQDKNGESGSLISSITCSLPMWWVIDLIISS
jgi:hypothetical protein